MLSGYECDENQTGWLTGLAVWATGAAAGCLLGVATIEPALLHWQVLALAVAVSLVSLGLRLPVMLSQCSDRNCLVHAVWMLAFFAQINWAGFLAVRSSNGTIAAEAILICLGLEAWLLVMFIARGQLPWLQQVFSGNADVQLAVAKESTDNREGEAPAEQVTCSAGAAISQVGTLHEYQDEVLGEITREFVDGIDENGQRYLSGSVRAQFTPQQRTETFVLSFCPALDGIADVDLECDSEDVSAKVEHATETGARIIVRRSSVGDATTVTVDWFATTSSTSTSPHSMNLP